MSDRIAGRTALVSGGTSGLGLVMARALLEAGVRVCITGRSRSAIEAAQALDESGKTVRGALCNVADPESVRQLADELGDEDISILVNNAGVAGPVASLVDVPVDAWDETMAVNVRGVFLMCQAFLPPMIANRRGDIVNIASVTGKRPLERRTPYCASKMAVLGLTRALALETGRYDVRVNTLSPGPVSGERMTRVFAANAELNGTTPAEAEQAMTSRAALGRLVDPGDVGAALVALLSMGSLTGADIDLSAGMIAPA